MSELFTTYERTIVERRQITQVTEQNIGQLAALIKGQVDYTGTAPVLIPKPHEPNPWRVKIGTQVSIQEGEPPTLVNRNGFNHADEWRVVEP